MVLQVCEERHSTLANRFSHILTPPPPTPFFFFFLLLSESQEHQLKSSPHLSASPATHQLGFFCGFFNGAKCKILKMYTL